MRELALFAGAGGGILGGLLCGFRTVCAVEIDPFCREVLLRRQVDGCLPRFPIWDDIRTFDGKPWRGHVDIVTGGFPCQDISSAGKRQGLAGSRSGLWFEMFRVIAETRPALVLAENSPHLRTRGLGTIVRGLASLGYDCRWGVLGDCHAGGATIGSRMWVVAKTDDACKRAKPKHAKMENSSEFATMASKTDSMQLWLQQRRASWENGQAQTELAHDDGRGADGCKGITHGLAHRVEQTRAIGNGQVPAVVRLAWEVLNA